MEENKNVNENEEVTENEIPKEENEEKDTSKDKKASKKEDKKLKEENEKIKAELSDINDRYTRMLAEYDNFRKRAQKEKEGVYADAVSDVLNAILPIKDSLEMAIKFADDSQFSQGVSMTLNKFNEILTKLGVSEFGEAGEEFDPNIHNGVLHVDDESLGEGIIAEVLQKGYKKGEKIIRYAMVKVAN